MLLIKYSLLQCANLITTYRVMLAEKNEMKGKNT